MSGRIHILSDDLASQIAAGEVVERPASVVKELVENSLDAGARRIFVSIESGGTSLIEVTDDGSGMSPEDAPLCLGRHATSKISDFASLLSLVSYGFRGEALPSIASVSRLSIKTRDAGTESGLLLSAHGTIQPELEPIGAPVGTTITVRELFFNVPARRKFLRSTNTESGHVTEVLIDAALARPDVTFTLVRDKKQQKSFPSAKSRSERVEQVLEAETLVRYEGVRGPLQVEAYLSPVERSRRGALGLKLLVNDRPVRDRALCSTIAHAFGSALSSGYYPRGVVYLTLSPELVDVNVHPQKTEVRFSDPRAVADSVHQIIKRGIEAEGRANPPDKSTAAFKSTAEPARKGAHGSASPSVASEVKLLRDAAAEVGGDRYRVLPGAGFRTPSGKSERSAEGHLSASLSRAADSRGVRQRPAYRFVAQVRRSYLVCESEDGLCILDQHAADETRIYRALREHLQAGQVPEQALLFPVTVAWGEKLVRAADKHRAELSRLGLELRLRGGGTLSLHSVPRLLVRTAPETILKEVASSLESGKGFASELLCRLACGEALSLGERLNQQDAEQLVRSLEAPLEQAGCTHGRPLLTSTTFFELSRKDSKSE